MQSSFYRRTLPKFILVLVALTMGLFMSGGNNAHAVFVAGTTVTVANKAVNADSDVTFHLTISSASYNFSSVINSTPAAAFVAPSPGATGFGAAHPQIGDIVGSLASTSTLGLTNGNCTSTLNPSFTFFAATVDNSSGNLINPIPQASVASPSRGVLENLWTDDASAPTSALPAGTGTTSTPPVNGLPAQVERYPSYLNTLFTPDGGSPVKPHARYAGAALVSGTTVILNLVIFENNALANAFTPPHPFSDLKNTGYTSIAVLQDPTQPAAPGAITDFCAPLTSTTPLFGESRINPCNGVTTAPCNTETGINAPTPGASTTRDRYRNPGTAGAYFFVSFHQSQRDADGDGKENQIDACPWHTDNFNIKTGSGNDPDADKIPGPPTAPGNGTGCDASSNPGFSDQDGDGWDNAGDNCAQASNATNVDSEVGQAYTTAASRGGPRSDGIGDACDVTGAPTGADVPNPSKGHLVADGLFETTLTLAPVCIGGTDADGDGYCSTATGLIPADPNDANAAIGPEAWDIQFFMAVAHSGSGVTPPMREPRQVCDDGIDNDGDGAIDLLDGAAVASSCRPKNLPSHPGFPACPATGCLGIDTDGDGFTDVAEWHVGTDALGRCKAAGAPDGTQPSTAWPADFATGGIPSSERRITLGDLTSFLGGGVGRKLGANPGAATFLRRYDIEPGPGAVLPTWININDLTALLGGASGNPPMFSGAKAFGGGTAPQCTNHPTYGPTPY
jgi:hypothetical protein